MLTAKDISVTVQRWFLSHGIPSRTEYTLPNGRRLDVAGIGKTGYLAGVEIKLDARDLNRDLKWPVYLQFCKVFYFAVPVGFPLDIIPEKCGILVSDGTTCRHLRGLTETKRFRQSVLLRA